jgi:hypothetical protein
VNKYHPDRFGPEDPAVIRAALGNIGTLPVPSQS